MEKELVNRVAQSGIRTLSLDAFRPPEPIFELDIKEFLFRGLVLKEKEFRDALKIKNWQEYEGGHLIVSCPQEAIIPMWAYMLIASYVVSKSKSCYVGTRAQFLTDYMTKQMDRDMDAASYQDQRVVIKGCGEFQVPPGVFAYASTKLIPHVRSLMYGEPCSTVPIYKMKASTR